MAPLRLGAEIIPVPPELSRSRPSEAMGDCSASSPNSSCGSGGPACHGGNAQRPFRGGELVARGPGRLYPQPLEPRSKPQQAFVCERSVSSGKRPVMTAETISILDGSTFAVSNRAGDMNAGPDQPHGFFYKDTRHLSRWVLTINGVAPAALSTDSVEYYFAQFFLAPPTGTIYRDPSLSLIRRRLIGEGFVEEITLMNHSAAPAELVVRIEAGADFADLFEVKDVLAKKGTLYREVRGGELVLGYRRGDFVRETQVGSTEPAEVDGQALVFKVRVAGKSE